MSILSTVTSRLFGKYRSGREAVRPLWHRVIEIAREKPWYADCGIADTVPGRFDAVTLVLAIVMLRMERDREREGNLVGASARLTELFVEDMDGQLRESGVGDLVVGKRMGKLVSVLGGRIGALRDALADSAQAPFRDALERNVTLNEGADIDSLAIRVRALHREVQALSDEDLLAARISR